MKLLQALCKITVIVAGLSVAVLRLIWYQYFQTLSPEALKLINLISIACAVILVISGLLWVLTEKMLSKKKK